MEDVLFLYLISNTKNNDYAYDSAIVATRNEEDARYIHPNKSKGGKWWTDKNFDWVHPKEVTVKKIGVVTSDIANTVEKGVVCSSYNAG